MTMIGSLVNHYFCIDTRIILSSLLSSGTFLNPEYERQSIYIREVSFTGNLYRRTSVRKELSQ